MVKRVDKRKRERGWVRKEGRERERGSEIERERGIEREIERERAEGGSGRGGGEVRELMS